MTETAPEHRREPKFEAGHEEEGKVAAVIAWALYILSLPSANLLVLVGLIVAYAGKGSATGVPRQHIEAQISLFWSVFWWTIGLWIVAIGSFISIILIPLGFLCLFALFLLTVWFTVKSVLGLLNLIGGRAP